jgi:alpha-1,4-glucan:alpha-1,4-glucan 6-glycosyltransferase/4-alpha-glucanotransferase
MADPEVLADVLGCLEIDGDPKRAEETLTDRRAARAKLLLEPVVVLDADQALLVPVNPGARARALKGTVTREDGECQELSIQVKGLRSGEDGSKLLVLPFALPIGYHQLELDDGARRSTSTLLVRPGRHANVAYAGWRGLGVSAPLFSLHSAHSIGGGDLSDLDRFSAIFAPAGVDVISTLPLVAGFSPEPLEPSPYLPISRRFWHDRWVDLEAARSLCSPRASNSSWRSATFEGRGLADALTFKRKGLEAIARAALVEDGPTMRSFHNFLERSPDVSAYARFRAAGERYGPDWQRWPVTLRGGSVPSDAVDPDVVRYHSFAQWLCSEQLNGIAATLESRGQGLALDLPLGTHPLGYDVYSEQDLYARQLSVGAPPDAFFPRGQQWGFPPPRPDAARLNGHLAFRQALRHHLAVASILRIDHVLGLQRLFVIPDGSPITQGVYLSSPIEELLAVVAIEAQRNGADIVGEDLGTVDPQLRALMDRDHLRRTYVAELHIEHGHTVLTPPPPGSVASFSTHDLPTFAGWWTDRDLEERIELGLLEASEVELLLSERSADRTRLASLVPMADAQHHASAPESLLDAVHCQLAASQAGLVMLQLDDLLGELDAVNLPGSSSERANWERLSTRSLEELEGDEALHDRVRQLRSLRDAARASETGPTKGSLTLLGGLSRMGALDDHLFNEGRHFRLYETLGSHQMQLGGLPGSYFAVWAPHAARVEVIGDFNEWDGGAHGLIPHAQSGVFEGFVPQLGLGERYKYRITSGRSGAVVDKADPFALSAELAPRTASLTAELRHSWQDQRWMAERSGNLIDRPMAVYELHLGSWRRVPEEGRRSLGYREIAPDLVEYVLCHGFTHVELLPVTEHPYYPSWGYQPTGFFGPTSRYGTPDDFAFLVDQLHQAGIGVLVDWVPAHFAPDDFALALFDGTHLYEHADERRRVHPDWGSLVFDYGRPEVRSFLVSSACSFLDRFHVDGLRFDAVASMLYLDYSRPPGTWLPNRYGGREDVEAVELIRSCNDEIHRSFPGAITIAEESTTWPGVTAATSEDGLGFDYKWDLGWMHDTLGYLGHDPLHRSWHLDELTFRSLYQDQERYILPLSHDEVVHGKGSLLNQVNGDHWQRFANLRLLYGLQYAQPGKKLLFMGDELGQAGEWDQDHSIDWHLLEIPEHAGILRLITELNALYRAQAPLHADQLAGQGFRILGADAELSVLCLERSDEQGGRLVACFNATPVPRQGYLVGVEGPSRWTLLLNSDDPRFGGSGSWLEQIHESRALDAHDHPYSISLDLPPLGFVYLALESG